MIYTLSEAFYEDPEIIGPKAHKLAILSKNGVAIVPHLIVGKGAFEEFIKHNKLTEKLERNSSRLDRYNPIATQDAILAWQKEIDATIFPETLRQKIAGHYVAIGPGVVVASHLSEFRVYNLNDLIVQIHKTWKDLLALDNTEGKSKGALIVRKHITNPATAYLLTTGEKLVDQRMPQPIQQINQLINKHLYFPHRAKIFVIGSDLYLEDINEVTPIDTHHTYSEDSTSTRASSRSYKGIGVVSGIKTGPLKKIVKDSDWHLLQKKPVIVLKNWPKYLPEKYILKPAAIVTTEKIPNRWRTILFRKGATAIEKVDKNILTLKDGVRVVVNGREGKVMLRT